MEHCLSVAGIPLPPLVKKVLMMERQKNNVWPFAHLEGIHHYQNISFHKLLQLLELEKKQSEELLLQLWKIVLMARIQIFKVTQKIRGKIWATILYHMFIHFVLVPKERFHCGQAIPIFLSKIYLVSNSILLYMTFFVRDNYLQFSSYISKSNSLVAGILD